MIFALTFYEIGNDNGNDNIILNFYMIMINR